MFNNAVNNNQYGFGKKVCDATSSKSFVYFSNVYLHTDFRRIDYNNAL